MDSKLDYVIVPAGPSDATELAEVHVRSWRETYPEMLPAGYLHNMSAKTHARRWAARLARTDEVTLAAEGTEGLVGYVSGTWARRGGVPAAEAEITTLYVLQSAQGIGLGRLLFCSAAQALAARGAASLILWALEQNRAARGFYEHLGGARYALRTELVGGQATSSVAYRWPRLGAWLAGLRHGR
ncbi:MAG: GNAT family N-acetyltransferase [Caulobacteraceae bacterium]|nr:GNAT family N-acetyltransferase [Caulobacteraceae bacterium]